MLSDFDHVYNLFGHALMNDKQGTMAISTVIRQHKKYIQKFSYKQFVSNWNSLSIDLKSLAEEIEFQQLLKDNI